MYGSEPDPADAAATADALEYLRANGYGPLMDALQDRENWTGESDARYKASRPIARRLCEILHISPIALKELMAKAERLVEQRRENNCQPGKNKIAYINTSSSN